MMSLGARTLQSSHRRVGSRLFYSQVLQLNAARNFCCCLSGKRCAIDGSEFSINTFKREAQPLLLART